MNTDDSFWGLTDIRWKSKQYYICQTGGLGLWLGLNFINFRVLERREPTREEYKEALLKFPYEISACRCKDCRYARVLRK
jgi:hypothetical protein